MAIVTIKIEDIADGKVRITADPTFETMMAMHTSGHDWTSGHGLAMLALNFIWRESKKKESKLILPKIGSPIYTRQDT